MTSLACLLKDLGHTVVGSDTEDEYFTSSILRNKKIEVLLFDKNNITSEYTYIISNAYDYKNEEVSKIILNDFKYFYYDKFIGSEMKNDIIAISGTHGKTTTTSFLAQMYNNEVSYIIGDGSGYGTKKSNLLILESCEYKDHFLSYTPHIALITNIDFDHPDYFLDINDVINSFQKFAYQTNMLVINNDDENCRRINHDYIYTFGFNNSSDYIIKIVKEDINGYFIELFDKRNDKYFYFNIPFLGIHYIYDFVGAFVIMKLLNKDPNLSNLKLPNRRMTEYMFNNNILIDDYAHHPSEIKCLYNAIKLKYSGYKLNVIFQPHTYSRTIALQDEFIKSLDLFDNVYIEKTFTSKREKDNLDNENLVNKLFEKYKKFDKEIINKIDGNKKEIWIFLGAGIVNKYISIILNKNKV